MGTGNTFRSDLYAIHSYVQNSMITHPKEVFINTLREFFSQDSYYHYVRDEWGFPKVPDHTDLLNDAGFIDDDTTRLFIGEYYRFDARYYPAMLVRSAGSRYVPISMSQNLNAVVWTNTIFVDGYGNRTTVATPDHFKENGAWEGSISIDIETLSPRSRDELVELASLLFMNNKRLQLQNAGVFIKGLSVSAPSEGEDRNDKLFKQTITYEIRSEWRRKIPINSVVDAITICIDFGNLETEPTQIAPNLRISSSVELLDALIDL
ncbi:hypothetical protein LCGC14_0523090 [marine sediment metagenome]|uniref:Uncharacterized protein n=1 Tax=marine sediment metagenome TaxID=412755 RepID=A0A0F9V648_9ZZZZ